MQPPAPRPRRLLIEILDGIAASDPDRPMAYIPVSSDPLDGWAPVSYGSAANGISYIASNLVKLLGRPSPGAFPTIAYIGPNDLRYFLLMLGASKAGFKALFVSPRNTEAAQLRLFADTDCRHLCHPHGGGFAKLAQPWLRRRREMGVVPMPELAVLLRTPVAHFPQERTFAQAEWDPLVVLHTSGSTGLPKPVVSPQGLWSVGDAYDDGDSWPELGGGARICYVEWAARAARPFVCFPLFHAGGLMLFAAMTLLRGTACALPVADRPLSADLIRASLQASGADAALMPSSILEDLSADEGGILVLRRLAWVLFGGGGLSTDVGNKLAARDVKLCNAMGSTEFGPYPSYYVADPKLWQYFAWNAAAMGCEFRRFSGTEDEVYELVAVRQAADKPGKGNTAFVFYTFPSLTEWSTRDLYKRHPTLADHWTHYGRIDNVVVFSNGEKLNPVTFEDVLSGHPRVRAALVVGQGRFQAALILEAADGNGNGDDDDSQSARDALVADVWPLVQEANAQTVAHGRVARELVMVAPRDKPFPRTGKGTVQRGLAAQLFAAELDALYAAVDEKASGGAGESCAPHGGTVPVVDASSAEAMAGYIAALLAALGAPADLAPDDDFFAAGMDSLQVANATRTLRAGLAEAGVSGAQGLTTGAFYAHPTAGQLAAHLLSSASSSSSSGKEEVRGDGQAESEIAYLNSLVAQLTRDPPLPRSKPSQRASLAASKDDEGQMTVVLTGSTGSLGTYLLAALLDDEICPRVSTVVALNRDADGGRARQTAAFKGRGFPVLWGVEKTIGDGDRNGSAVVDGNEGRETEKTKAETKGKTVQFLHADLSQPMLGLSAAAYASLLVCTDRIIHNAWPVNFHLPASSFAPHVSGTRNLLDLAAGARKRAALVFVSSRGAVEAWPRLFGGDVDVPPAVPEESMAAACAALPGRTPDPLGPAVLGYGRAKAAASLVMDAVGMEAGVPCATVRLGQIAGPKGGAGAGGAAAAATGARWNEHEWLPSLVRSSLHLGKLPREIGSMSTVDWMPVEDVAGLVLDVAGAAGRDATPVDDVRGYFHGVNPNATTWAALVPALVGFYGVRIKEVVGFEAWLAALEASAALGGADEAAKNPAVKLLDVYKSFVGEDPVLFSTERAKQRSPTIKKLEAVSPDLLRSWCLQWAF